MTDYYSDKMRAIDAKTKAQEIAFAPLAFQTVLALRNLGMLKSINDAGDAGLSAEAVAEKAGVSLYGAKVLLEFALGMGVVKLVPEVREERYVLSKTGWFLLEDDMTRVNMDFVNDICYKGAFNLTESVKNGRPEGLSVFGKWTTIYEALSTLPEQAKKSWFAFDHFYSDIAFPEALPIVFAQKPKKILDIGGNTAKWSICCCKYDPDVKVTIVDLPGQTAVARENAAKAGFGERIDTCEGNILADSTVLPTGYDAVWMSQFLDCFSLKQVTKIIKKVVSAAGDNTDIFVLEPLWDCQKFQASSYSLQATSIYFTCMANGNSKMYRCQELTDAIEAGGAKLETAHHNLGSNSYSLLRFRKK
ncbi:MAG: class I SAM-dependent methyltransferase [Spirochaetia bacterium]|nr:class I SAM-dependent methyltransferase [Spirochaetia bacterium]